MNAPPVQQTIGTRPLGDSTLEQLISFLDRVVFPVVNQLRRLANSLAENNTLSIVADASPDPAIDLVLADATSGNVIVTLPGAQNWIRVKVVKTDATANTVTVVSTFMGNAVLAAQGDYVDLKSDGTAYY